MMQLGNIVNCNIVEVEPPPCPFPLHYLHQLQETVDPLQESNEYGIDLFLHAKDLMLDLLS